MVGLKVAASRGRKAHANHILPSHFSLELIHKKLLNCAIYKAEIRRGEPLVHFSRGWPAASAGASYLPSHLLLPEAATFPELIDYEAGFISLLLYRDAAEKEINRRNVLDVRKHSYGGFFCLLVKIQKRRGLGMDSAGMLVVRGRGGRRSGRVGFPVGGGPAMSPQATVIQRRTPFLSGTSVLQQVSTDRKRTFVVTGALRAELHAPATVNRPICWRVPSIT